MANKYMSATVNGIFTLGGNKNNESQTELRKCIPYSRLQDPSWSTAHNCYYNNHTGFVYSSDRIMALDDISISSGQPTTQRYYWFKDGKAPRTLYVRSVNSPLCTQMQDRINYLGAISAWDNSQIGRDCFYHGDCSNVEIVGSGGGLPMIMYYTTYYPEIAAQYEVSTFTNDWGALYNLVWDYVDEEVQHNELFVPYAEVYLVREYQAAYIAEEFTCIYPMGSYIHAGHENTVIYEKSLFGLTNHITLDFHGMNCRNTYFSFVLGGNEAALLQTIQNNMIPVPGERTFLGWSEDTKVGYGYGFGIDENTTEILWNNTEDYDGGEVIPIYPYTSIDSVWVSSMGFGVIFKDTDQTNGGGEGLYNYGEETFVVGLNVDPDSPYYQQWNTNTDGFIITCKNFRMK